MLAEALKQLVDQPGLRQRLAKQPDRGGIRHWVLEFQIEKAHERPAVADQVLSPIVREIVERLQHRDLELQDRVIGLAAGVALALLGLRLRHGLDVSTEILPWHDLLDRFQRIALGADRLQPALNIEKALLPHDSLAPSALPACGHRVRFAGTWREEFFEAPLILGSAFVDPSVFLDDDAWLKFIGYLTAHLSGKPIARRPEGVEKRTA